MLKGFEKKYSNFLSFGLFFITILVIAGPVTDPVNVPKMLALSTFSFGALTYLLLNRNYKIIYQEKPIYFLSLFFIGFSMISVFMSTSPFTQNLYGIYGRNTGLLTYLSFIFVFAVISIFKDSVNLERLYIFFILAGLVNVVYGFVVEIFGDPIIWNNNYGALLSLLGNPDFGGALYGILSAILLAYAFKIRTSKLKAIATIIFMFASLYCVLLTKTTQGILVAAISISIVLLLYVYIEIKNRLFLLSLLFITFFSGILTTLGMFQIGPLANLVYKRSVSLRGVYWDAAINTGISHLFSGVGFDAFGDWYRRSRSLKASTWFPGPETITNVAHNYYLDIFANGGILLLTTYIGISTLGLISIFKILKGMKKFEFLPVVMITFYFGFQAQALISIPQIGLSVWGWVNIASLYSYSKLSSHNVPVNKIFKKSKSSNPNETPVGVLIFVGMIIGFILAMPAYISDAKWTNAINSQDVKRVDSALQPSYLNPYNSDRLANAALLLQRSNFSDKAHEVALKGIKYNPDFFSAWKILYYLPASTENERKIALANMKRLDPLNPNLEKLK